MLAMGGCMCMDDRMSDDRVSSTPTLVRRRVALEEILYKYIALKSATGFRDLLHGKNKRPRYAFYHSFKRPQRTNSEGELSLLLG